MQTSCEVDHQRLEDLAPFDHEKGRRLVGSQILGQVLCVSVVRLNGAQEWIRGWRVREEESGGCRRNRAGRKQLYGVYGEKNLYGKKCVGVNRETFLIDKDGIVRKVWPKVNPDDHASEALEEVDALKL